MIVRQCLGYNESPRFDSKDVNVLQQTYDVIKNLLIKNI